MAETQINIESPNVQVDAPVDVGLKGFTQDIVDRVTNLVDKVKQGDDDIMTVLFLGVAFVVAGVFVWRRL
jgi:hypothetical protein